jgi:hypothetical protein
MKEVTAMLPRPRWIGFGNRGLLPILGQSGAVLAECIKFLLFAAFMIAEMWNGRRPDVQRPCAGDIEPAG